MSRTHSRRAFLTGSLGLGALGALAACQSGTPPTPAERVVERVVTQVVEKEKIVERQVTVVAAAPAKAKTQGTIVFWGHDNHPVPNAAPGFEERNPNVKFKAEALGDWLVKFRTTLASGTDVPDLVWLEATTVQELGAKDVLLDVTDIVAPNRDKLSKGKLVETMIAKSSKYMAVPGDIGLCGLWYREDLFAKAGVKEIPKGYKLEDFVKLSAQLRKEADVASFVLPKAGYNRIFQLFLSQNGGSVTSLDGVTVTIDDDKGVAAMTQIKQLWDTGGNLDTAIRTPTYWAAVKSGKIASDLMPAWERGFLAGELKSPAEGLGQWRVVPLPAVPNGISVTAQNGGASLASTRFTKNPDAVKAYQEYAFMSVDGATAVGSWGIIPSYLPYLDSPLFQNQKSPVFGDYPFSKVWAELAKDLSTVYARTAVFGEAMTAVNEEMIPMLTGQVPIKDGMKKLGDKVRQANARYQ
jgi:lactose/L-arabinose transport system substrate-binding protein